MGSGPEGEEVGGLATGRGERFRGRVPPGQSATPAMAGPLGRSSPSVFAEERIPPRRYVAPQRTLPTARRHPPPAGHGPGIALAARHRLSRRRQYSRSLSKLSMLRVSVLNATPTRYTGRPSPRYFPA